MTALTTIWTLAQRGQPPGPPDGHMWGWWGWGSMWAVGLVAAAVLVALVGLVVWALLRGSPNRTAGSPQDVLDDRYAHGDLSTEEYRERSEVLRGSSRRSPRS